MRPESVPPRPPRGRALALALCAGLAALLAGWAIHRRTSPPADGRVCRVWLRVGAGEGVTEPQRRGLEQMIQDHLEVLGAFPVLAWRETRPPAPGPALHLQVEALRSGSDLGLRTTWSWTASGPGTVDHAPPAPPGASLRRWMEGLPLGLKAPGDGRLCPAAPQAFWDLAESMGLLDVRSETARAEALARSVLQAAPDCAEAHLNLGIHLYSRLQWKPRGELGEESAAIASFQQALERVPGHPRSARELAVLLADTGRSKEALQGLRDAVARRPTVPRLYEALTYAARVSGLLDLSRRALGTQHRLALGQTRQVGETTLLYLGDWDAFLDTCRPRSSPVDAKAWYYQGYVALAQGRREAALKAFQASTAVPEGWYGFEELSRIMAFHLQGRGGEARQALAALGKAREGLRISDGEFTFKQAEAWALLGDSDEAMNQLTRALSQGFCCVAWYERSPFLGPVRAHPQWTHLLQHAKERQALREGEFSPGRFGL